VILLDLNLPKKDGREVLAEIKGDERLRQIPVVILTTSKAEEDILRSYKLHANAYITKPVDFDQYLKAVRQIDGSFALVARDGKTVRMARSLDRPMRYFLAKRAEGPALIVADRIDAIYQQLKSEGLDNQFHPSYTRMVPAHYVVEIQLVGCPDPDPTYTRFFNPQRNALPADLHEIGAAYISALAGEIIKWLRQIPEREPVGICFSGGIDSGAVFS
jgi:asparagine synthetase B (glutamine-hydrolysing)